MQATSDECRATLVTENHFGHGTALADEDDVIFAEGDVDAESGQADGGQFLVAAVQVKEADDERDFTGVKAWFHFDNPRQRAVRKTNGSSTVKLIFISPGRETKIAFWQKCGVAIFLTPSSSFRGRNLTSTTSVSCVDTAFSAPLSSMLLASIASTYARAGVIHL